MPKKPIDKIKLKKIKQIAIIALAGIIVCELGYIFVSHLISRHAEQTEIAENVHTTAAPAAQSDETAAEETPTEETPTEDAAAAAQSETPAPTDEAGQGDPSLVNGSKIIVLDPGHGKSSSKMTDAEKKEYGWKQTSKGWGEWRHYKIGSGTVDCEGSGCNGRHTPNGACWYPIGNGDRSTEPDLNLQNALAARKYLIQMGYTVRMTRETNDENPSITRRLEYCYPNRDKSREPDAALFLCIHSNAGGGRGSAYIELGGTYDQLGVTDAAAYAAAGNRLGKLCNDEIVNTTSLSMHGSGVIGGEPELIAFMKSPVTCGYLEIGFFDNSSDLNILNTESDSIGKAIAAGIDAYIKETN